MPVMFIQVLLQRYTRVPDDLCLRGSQQRCMVLVWTYVRLPVCHAGKITTENATES
jgi:hypothetical protein